MATSIVDCVVTGEVVRGSAQCFLLGREWGHGTLREIDALKADPGTDRVRPRDIETWVGRLSIDGGSELQRPMPIGITI